MKFDLHCHTKSGSIDARVSLERYIELLKQQGFHGMLVTDHDSYRGYRQWRNSVSSLQAGSFVVLEGIEYDTKDAGHFLVIMPDGVQLDLLRIRGMSIEQLIHVVHHMGGILGPAHPFGSKSSSAMFFKKVRRNPRIFYEFDFVEGFNTCESAQANRIARLMAARYGKPCTGGSDSHEEKYVGMAYTEIDADIRNNDDLIEAILEHRITDFGGTVRDFTRKARHKNAFYAVWGFKVYNRSLCFLFTPRRNHRIRKLSIPKLRHHPGSASAS